MIKLIDSKMHRHNGSIDYIITLNATMDTFRDEKLAYIVRMTPEGVMVEPYFEKEGERMTIRDALDHIHEVECECDRCHCNTYTHEFDMMANYIDPVRELCECLECDGWIVTDNEEFICPECQDKEESE